MLNTDYIWLHKSSSSEKIDPYVDQKQEINFVWPKIPLTLLLCFGREKKEHTVCTCSVSPGNFGNLSITLTSARHIVISHVKNACHWPRPVWMMMKERLRQKVLRLSMCPSFQLNAMACDWRNLSLWSFLIILNEAMQTVTVRVFDFKTTRRCLTGNISVAFQQVNNFFVNFSVTE